MGPIRFSKEILTQMRLSQLRELARRLGIWRYSSMLRDQLVSAIQVRSPQEDFGSDNPKPLTEDPQTVGGVNAVDEEIASAGPGSAAGISTWVTLMPQDHQWAIARWAISPVDREKALAAGGLELALRLTDVTGSEDGGAHPHTLQQLVVAAGSQEWHLPVPVGDREYKVELGYRTADGGWYSLVLSSVVRMPAESAVSVNPQTPFSFETANHDLPWTAPLPAPGLHERLYQQASASLARLGLGSETFLGEGEHGIGGAGGQFSGAGQLSGAGLWASGREASGAGLPPRPRSFWLVADAELIVYGATDPAATLRVGDRVLPLGEDGTFVLHATFPDGEQHYPIRALAADGEQRRSITLDFHRSTPHAKVNTQEEAVAEWF
jgi:hypothetical protein